MIATSLASAAHADVPGVDSYTLNFDIDYSVVESGQYQYGGPLIKQPDGSAPKPLWRRMNGGYIGLEEFYPLDLDVTFQSGKQVKKTIDVPGLIEALIAQHDIPDLRDTEEGGGAALNVEIKQESIEFTYVLYEDFRGPNGEFFFTRQEFPMPGIDFD